MKPAPFLAITAEIVGVLIVIEVALTAVKLIFAQ